MLYAARGHLEHAAEAFRGALDSPDIETSTRASLYLGIVTRYKDEPIIALRALRETAAGSQETVPS